MLQTSHDILEHNEVVVFGGFDDAVDDSTGVGADSGLAEQPVFPADEERFDCSFRAVVVDGEVTIECVTNQFMLLI